MNDEKTNEDNRDAICEPLIRIEANLRNVSSENEAASHGESEPCAIAPLTTIEAKLGNVDSAKVI